MAIVPERECSTPTLIVSCAERPTDSTIAAAAALALRNANLRNIFTPVFVVRSVRLPLGFPQGRSADYICTCSPMPTCLKFVCTASKRVSLKKSIRRVLKSLMM